MHMHMHTCVCTCTYAHAHAHVACNVGPGVPQVISVDPYDVFWSADVAPDDVSDDEVSVFAPNPNIENPALAVFSTLVCFAVELIVEA